MPKNFQTSQYDEPIAFDGHLDVELEDLVHVAADVDDEAVAHVYSVYLHLRDWNKPHYRASTFGADIRANLSNVAAPGTGVPSGRPIQTPITCRPS